MNAKWLWKASVVAGGVLFATSLAVGQVPAVPAAPVAAPPLPGSPAVPVAAPKMGIFARFCATLDDCRRKICATPAGEMLNNMTKPASAFTGGVIPGFCPIMPSDKDLDKPGVAGTSDAIKKDALEAGMRREKVRFLATVDCRYYPDATKALTAALRTDGSECVRFEAAAALSRGCCCNQKTIDALDASVSGTDRDGNPAERSTRVRCVAAIALEKCLACYVPPEPEVEPEIKKDNIEIVPPGETPLKKLPDMLPLPTPTPKVDAGSKKAATAKADGMQTPSKKSIEMARQTLNDFTAMIAATRPQAANLGGDRSSVMHVIRASAIAPNTSMAAVRPAMAMTSPIAVQATLGQPSPAGVATIGPPTAEPSAMPTAMTPGYTPDVPPASPPAPFVPNTNASADEPPHVAVNVNPNPVAPVLTQMLKGATAAERHAAIRQLVRFDWRENPIVVSGLIAGAKNDPAPAVRVDCLRHLAGYRMDHPQVIVELGGMTGDPDMWVREEAIKALGQLRPMP